MPILYIEKLKFRKAEVAIVTHLGRMTART
jgi:hypothetical protein